MHATSSAPAAGAEPAARVLRALQAFRGVVLREAMRQTIKFLHGHNASFATITALIALQQRGDQSVSQLAREIGLSLAATSQLVDRLVQEKLVARTESSVDRRRKQLALTAAGRGFLSRMDGAYSVAAERSLRDVPSDALLDLEAALAGVVAHVNRDS
jgi:DNA-binding MarR family transcriptional regulator